MTLEATYARALFDAVQADASKGSEYLTNLKEALVRRGHQKLLHKIYSEYERLLLKEKRSKSYQTVTPEQERTRVLLELYRNLIQTNTSHE